MNTVLYIPTGLDLWRTLSRLGEFAEGESWDVGAYTRDWAELVRLIAMGEYQIGVVSSITQLPPNRLPRIVAADDPTPSATMHPRARWLPGP